MTSRKVCLITGASSGIGQSITALLAERGSTVFGTSRSPHGIERRPGLELLPLDVRSDQSVAACVDAVMTRAGRVDVVINNAGYVLGGAIEEVTIEEAKQQFETNLFGTMRVVRAVLPILRRQRSGTIINISSLAGLVAGPPFVGIYSASKYALESYTEHLWREVRPFGIRVALVEPGSIRTNLTRNALEAEAHLEEYDPWRRRALESLRRHEQEGPEPSRVAEVVLSIVEDRSPKLRHRVGTDATWVPRLRQVLPESLFDKQLRKEFDLGAME